MCIRDREQEARHGPRRVEAYRPAAELRRLRRHTASQDLAKQPQDRATADAGERNPKIYQRWRATEFGLCSPVAGELTP